MPTGPDFSRRQKFLLLSLLALLAAAGVVMNLIATKWGSGLSPDSVSYIRLARRWVEGKQYASSHFPPGLPAVLAAFGLGGIEPLVAIRWLNSVLCGAMVLLTGVTIARATAPNLWPAVLGSVVVLASPAIFEITTMAWSEPLFLCCGLVAALCCIEFWRRDALYLLVVCGLAASVAWLTRHVGASIVLGILLALLAPRAPFRERVRISVVFLAAAALPQILWRWQLQVSSSGYGLGFHPPNKADLLQALLVVRTWLLPGPRRIAELDALGWILLLAFALLTLALAVGYLRKLEQRDEVERRALLLFLLLAAGHLGAVLAAKTLLSAYIPLDSRILSPLMIYTIPLWILLLSRSLAERRIVRASLAIAFVLVTVAAGVSSKAQLTHRFQENGRGGYAARHWKESQTIAAAHRLPAGIFIATNGPDVFYILTGRTSSLLPRRFDPHSERPNETYLSEMGALRDKLAGGGFVVYFDSVRRGYLPTGEQLVTELGLILVEQLQDGAIYRLAGAEVR